MIFKRQQSTYEGKHQSAYKGKHRQPAKARPAVMPVLLLAGSLAFAVGAAAKASTPFGPAAPSPVTASLPRHTAMTADNLPEKRPQKIVPKPVLKPTVKSALKPAPKPAPKPVLKPVVKPTPRYTPPPAPRYTPPPTPKAVVNPAPHVAPGGAAACIRKWESGENYTAQNPASTASGAYQFLDTTWQATTGLPGRAMNYSPAQQDAAFDKLWAGGAGASQWVTAYHCI